MYHTSMLVPQSEMDSTPHYGKLDHGVRKGTTLPGTVIPPTGDEYGKLDRVCICTHVHKISIHYFVTYIYMYMATETSLL